MYLSYYHSGPEALRITERAKVTQRHKTTKQRVSVVVLNYPCVQKVTLCMPLCIDGKFQGL